MNRLILLVSIAVITFFNWAFATETENSSLIWTTNYEEACVLSKKTGKPLVLFFTGSDWCSWCSKLDEEALATSEFAEAVNDRFIFLKVDFPMHIILPIEQIKQNKSLQDKFSVRSFPVLVLLDANQKQIGTVGYRPGDGKQFAAHLLKMIDNYASYRNKMQQLSHANLNGKDLKRLYQKAHELGLKQDALEIVNAGVNSDQQLFFQTELYRIKVNEGKIDSTDTKDLRQKLLSSETNNKQLTHYQIALIDFESNCGKLEKGDGYTPEQAVIPLITYIDVFGKQDVENLWRLHMVISQVYLDQNYLNEALHYARKSYESAPTKLKPEIAKAVKNIESKLESQTS